MIKFVSADSQIKKHYILNQTVKKINYFVITLQKVKKSFIMLFKNTLVSACFITKSNIYCIN